MFGVQSDAPPKRIDHRPFWPGVIGFGWNGYESWPLALGSRRIAITLISPMSALAVLAAIAFLPT